MYASARKSAVSWQRNVAHVTLTARKSTLLCSFMYKFTRSVNHTCIGAGFKSVAAWFLDCKTARNRVKMCKSAQRKHSSFKARKNDFLSTWLHIRRTADLPRASRPPPWPVLSESGPELMCRGGLLQTDPQERAQTLRGIFGLPVRPGSRLVTPKTSRKNNMTTVSYRQRHRSEED